MSMTRRVSWRYWLGLIWKGNAMASVIKVSGGKTPARAVQFVDVDGDRRTIRLGRIGHDQAERFKTRVELLVHAKAVNEPPGRTTSEWLAGLPDKMHDRLAAFGLTSPRASARLGAWLDQYIGSRTDLKPSSREKLLETRAKLLAHFPSSTPLGRITVADAKGWALWLRTNGRSKAPNSKFTGPRGLSEATARSHAQGAKTMFGAAIEAELIIKNPFSLDISRV